MAWTQRPDESANKYAVRKATEDGLFTFVNGVALVNEPMLLDFLERYDTNIY
jgi:hypothetical protein